MDNREKILYNLIQLSYDILSKSVLEKRLYGKCKNTKKVESLYHKRLSKKYRLKFKLILEIIGLMKIGYYKEAFNLINENDLKEVIECDR